MKHDEPTVAEILGIQENDPWDRRSIEQRGRDKVIAEARKLLAAQPDAPIGSFVDPANDESMAFVGKGDNSFRITVPQRRLSEIVAVDDNIPAIAVVMRNNAAGCWFVVNSRRVASRVATDLVSSGFTLCLEKVAPSGDLVDESSHLDEESWG